MVARKIIVTGCSRGLGLEMVRGFVEKGHTVIGCARNEAMIKSLRGDYDQPHRFDVVDVANDDHVAAWATSVLESHGAPDLLINNAARMNANATLWEVPADEFSQVVDVNIKGIFHVIRHYVPAMIFAGSGVIANFSSGWGRSTSPEVAPYCATKWAVEGLTSALAKELPSGLCAVAVNPGIINTDMLQICFGGSANTFPDAKDWALRAVPFLLKLDRSDNGSPVSI